MVDLGRDDTRRKDPSEEGVTSRENGLGDKQISPSSV